MNTKSEINQRNIKFFKKFFGITKDEFFDKMRKAGKPKGFGEDKWSDENPTAGRCGSVVGAIRLSGKIPENYTACWQRDSRDTFLLNK